MSKSKATGIARLDGKRLTITTNAKRGKKIVKLTVTYLIRDVEPDQRVAFPAFSLQKGIFRDDPPEGVPAFVPLGQEYHLGVNEWGPFCDCPHATYRGANSEVVCKHCAACIVVGLLPK